MKDTPAFSLDQNDITFLRERSGRRTLWLSEDCLTRNLKGLTENYLRNACRHRYRLSVSPTKRDKDTLPDTGESWRFARKNGQFYYCYDNIPDVAPANYKSRLPQPEQLAEMAKTAVKSDRLKGLETLVKERLEVDAPLYYQHYYRYSTEQMQVLSRACAALQAALDLGYPQSYSGAWLQDFGAVLDRVAIRYLPTNWRRLKQKLTEVLDGKMIHEVIDLPRVDNQNARKLDDTEVESWVMQMRGMPQNFTNAYIIRKVRTMCEMTGRQLPSESWIAALLAQPATKFLTSAGRYGERGRLGQVYKDYTPIANALFANDCWQMDGTRVNFIPWIGEDGREKHLYMVVCRDVHSGAVLGASFSLSEDRWAYTQALAMACRVTNSLPYEVVIDRFPGHNTPEWQTIEGRLQAVGVRVSHKFTAQGKAQLERWFGTLQSVFFMESPYYYGEGIQSKRQAAHRSAEYLKAIQKVAKGDGWNIDTATREALWCIGKYNETALSTYSRKHATIDQTPNQIWATSEKPHMKTVCDWQRTMLFGLMKKVSIRNGMVRTEIQKAEYHYTVRDYEVLKNNNQVWLAYDLEDLERAWLFEDDDQRLLNPNCLCEVALLPRVQVFGPNADYKALGKEAARKGQTENKRKADLAEIAGRGSEMHLLLNGMGSKAEAETAESNWLAEHTEIGQRPLLVLANGSDEVDNWNDEPHPEFDALQHLLGEM